MSEETKLNQDPVTGRFVKGNTAAWANRGNKHKLNQAFLDFQAMRTAQGLAPWQIMAELEDDPNSIPELRYKAAKARGDWEFKGDVNVNISSDDSVNAADIKAEILATLGSGFNLLGEPEEADKEDE